MPTAVGVGMPIGTHVSTQEGTSSKNAADRLKELEELKKSGMITEQEFATKKQEILSSV